MTGVVGRGELRGAGRERMEGEEEVDEELGGKRRRMVEGKQGYRDQDTPHTNPSPRPLRLRRLRWRFFCGGPVSSSDGAGRGARLGVCTRPLGYGAARSMAPILGMAITTAGFGAHTGRAATDRGALSLSFSQAGLGRNGRGC